MKPSGLLTSGTPLVVKASEEDASIFSSAVSSKVNIPKEIRTDKNGRPDYTQLRGKLQLFATFVNF